MKTMILILVMLLPLFALAEENDDGDLGFAAPGQEDGALQPGDQTGLDPGVDLGRQRPSRPERPGLPHERLSYECVAVNALRELYVGTSLSAERAAQSARNKCYFGSEEVSLARTCQVRQCRVIRFGR